MVCRWNPYEIQLSCFMVLAFLSEIQDCDALNPEGLALLEFRDRIAYDPYEVLANWNYNHSDPCLWQGVQCVNGKVQMLDLSGFSLQGPLTPALRKLRYMKSLVMSNNNLSGFIPKEISELKLLELLDLSDNNLTGNIPTEIGVMPSLKCLLVCGNNLQNDSPTIGMLDYLVEPGCNHRLKSPTRGEKDYSHMPGPCVWWRAWNRIKGYFGMNTILRTNYANCCYYSGESNCCHNIPNGSAKDNVRRHLGGDVYNLASAPANAIVPPPQGANTVLSSGSFSAKKPPQQPQPQPLPNQPIIPLPVKELTKGPVKMYVISALSIGLLVTVCFAFIGFRRRRVAKAARAQDASLLQRLSKVFVTGVPKLNSSELETACEDFSNIIETFSGCLMYKGILSSGVEIAVLSTSIRSSQQWSKQAEREFKRKLDTFSRINHKNFVNVLGYCEEQDPFVRMMVFEYAPNGNLYEHLHAKDMDHLDWTTRMRIVMGTCYCLQHMHHELNPPYFHPNLQSDSILLTEDYSAKVADVSFWGDIVSKARKSDDEELEPLNSNSGPTREDNVFSLGILILEIISTKSLSVQAMQYMRNKEENKSMVDPTLKSFKENELEALCEVILECVNDDPRHRPTLNEVVSKLFAVTKITPEAATSRNSPLWWAELEILDMDDDDES